MRECGSAGDSSTFSSREHCWIPATIVVGSSSHPGGGGSLSFFPEIGELSWRIQQALEEIKEGGGTREMMEDGKSQNEMEGTAEGKAEPRPGEARQFFPSNPMKMK